MTVKLESLKADLGREEAGDWVEYPDYPGLAFRVSSLHTDAYVVERDLLLQRLTRVHKGKPIPPSALAPEIGKLYCKHILHEWRGLDEEYSPALALEVLCDPAFRDVVSAIEWCAGRLAAVDAEFVDGTEKNSDRPSAGG